MNDEKKESDNKRQRSSRQGGYVGGESYIEKVVDEVSRGRKLHTKEVK